MFSFGRCEVLICKHSVNFSEKSPHFFKFPGSKVKGYFTSPSDRVRDDNNCSADAAEKCPVKIHWFGSEFDRKFMRNCGW